MDRTIGVILKPGAPEALVAARKLQELVSDARWVTEKEGYHAVEGLPAFERLQADEFEAACSLAVVFGGDGTLIHAASLFPERAVPILGINLGKIGFLTEVTLEGLSEAVQLAISDSLPVQERMRLDVSIEREGAQIAAGRLLNDAVLSQAAMARINSYRVFCDDQFVTRVRGDGVIIATPTGTTAYALAAGGAILTPDMEAITITPISPHQLTQRPLVVGADTVIRVEIDSETPVVATFDGQAWYDFQRGDVLRIQRAPVPAFILSAPGRSYFKMLRTKLRWGDSE